MDSKTQSPDKGEPKKKVYRPPKLHVYGDINELTQSTGRGRIPDGKGDPTVFLITF